MSATTDMPVTYTFRASRAARSCLSATFLALCLVPPAAAHNGPPFPIITDQRVGPCIISLWTHPDIGTGTFFVMVDPPPGGKVPGDLIVQIGVQPVSGRSPEVIYSTRIEDLRGQLEYKTEVQFDQQDFFKIRLILVSSGGGGEALSQVEATPMGYGRWDLLLFLLPFLGVGFLWFKIAAKRRQLRKMQPQLQS
jgi:hypothetical protein